jgi:CBS-domain-containing membrane protein
MMRITEATKHFLFQPLGGAGMIMLLLFSDDFIFSETIIASFGATIFIASTRPHSKHTQPRYLIGGYSCGIISGLFGFFMCGWLPPVPLAVFAGLAVGLATCLMVGLRFEHPPASALALGLALSQRPVTEAMFSFFGIITVCVVLHFAKPYMKNL